MMNRRDLFKRASAAGILLATRKFWSLDQTMMGSGSGNFVDITDQYDAFFLGDLVEFPTTKKVIHFDAGRRLVTYNANTGAWSLAKAGDPVYGWLDHIGSTPLVVVNSDYASYLRSF